MKFNVYLNVIKPVWDIFKNKEFEQISFAFLSSHQCHYCLKQWYNIDIGVK